VRKGEADRGVEAFPLRADVTGRVDYDDGRKALDAEEWSRVDLRIERDVAERVAAGKVGGDGARLTDVDGHDRCVRMRAPPALDQRQLDFARFAPARVKIQEDDPAALVSDAKRPAIEQWIDRVRRGINAWRAQRARSDEDLPQRKRDRENREGVPNSIPRERALRCLALLRCRRTRCRIPRRDCVIHAASSVRGAHRMRRADDPARLRRRAD
jgi:hypothetical protein